MHYCIAHNGTMVPFACTVPSSASYIKPSRRNEQNNKKGNFHAKSPLHGSMLCIYHIHCSIVQNGTMLLFACTVPSLRTECWCHLPMVLILGTRYYRKMDPVPCGVKASILTLTYSQKNLYFWT